MQAISVSEARQNFKRYCDDVVENKDIVMITGANIPHSKPVQLELLRNTTIVGRAWYNWGGTSNATKDKAIIYNYPTDYTMTAKVEKYNIAPTPGVLAEGQVPATVAG